MLEVYIASDKFILCKSDPCYKKQENISYNFQYYCFIHGSLGDTVYMLKTIFIIILLLIYANVPAANNLSQIAQGIGNIINNSEFSNANIGILVQSLDNKAILYQKKC